LLRSVVSLGRFSFFVRILESLRLTDDSDSSRDAESTGRNVSIGEVRLLLSSFVNTSRAHLDEARDQLCRSSIKVSSGSRKRGKRGKRGKRRRTFWQPRIIPTNLRRSFVSTAVICIAVTSDEDCKKKKRSSTSAMSSQERKGRSAMRRYQGGKRRKRTVVNLILYSYGSVLVCDEVCVRSRDESEHSLCPESELSSSMCR